MKRYLIAGVLVAAAGADVAAQEKLPPIRSLGTVSAATKDSLGMIGHIRALSNGNVLVNDIQRRQVKLLDKDLNLIAVVADSTSSTANAYGPRPGGLIAYRGDSTLFVDPASLSMLMIDPNGKIARVMSVPRSQEVNALTSVSFGSPGFDSEGRLVYRANADLRTMMGMAGGRAMATAGAARTPGTPVQGAGGAGILSSSDLGDTAAIVRLDLATRKLDTLTWIKAPRMRNNMSRNADGNMTMTLTVNPLPLVDEWVVTSDGRVAIVRSSDYHVDWVSPDGKLQPAAKVPFEWQRLTDEDKSALIDSVKAMRDRMTAQQQSAPGGAPQVAFGGATGIPAPPQIRMEMRVEGGPGGPTQTQRPQIVSTVDFVSPSELPDYKPPFLANSVRADAEGNIWVRTVPTKQIPGGIVYDVINGKGELVERVQIPAGREIRGFGPGVAYLMGAVDGRIVIETAKLR